VTSSAALRALKMLGHRGLKAARIAELRCRKGHLLVTLLEAPQDGFLVAWPPRKMPRPPSAWRRGGFTPPTGQPAPPARVELFIPELLDALRTQGQYESRTLGAFCDCSTSGGVRIPLSYLAEITAAGRGQDVVIADPQRVRSARQPRPPARRAVQR